MTWRPHEIQAARRELGMTQADLGRFLKLASTDPARTVRKWETGRAPVTGPVEVAITLELENRKLRKRLERKQK